MKRLALILSLFIAAPAWADEIRAAGSTSQCLSIFVSDSSSSTGAGLTGLAYNSGSLTCYYFRNEAATGETATSITLASSTLGTYTSGAFKEISSSNMPGWYEFCPPDAALAAGARAVAFQCKGASNMAPMNLRVVLEISDTIYPARATAQSVTSSTIVLAAAEAFGDDELNNNTAVHVVSASTGAGQTRCICDYVSSTDTATLCENWTTNPTGTITYNLVPSAHCDALRPTTYGRTLDVASTGEAGLDLGNTTGTLDAAEIGSAALTTAKFGSGAIDSTVLADGVVTANKIASSAITSAKFAAGAVDASAIAASAIGSSELATDAVDADSLASDFVTEIWAKVVEAQGSYTAQQVLSIALSALAGEWTAPGTFKSPNGSATRISGTAASSAPYRSSITLSPSS